MPIAKEDLKDGFVVVAVKGSYVSNDAVKAHGWEDKVEAGEDPVANAETSTKDALAPKGAPQKGE